MNNLTKTRGTLYATSFVVGVAGVLKLMGLAEFDASTGMIDPHPFSVYLVAGLLAPVFTAGLAMVAVIKGWGQKVVKNDS